MNEKTPREQLEEGEIIDDDDFEDISDNSIVDSALGKFVSNNENLRALSSSDCEIERLKVRIRHKRKALHRKHRIKPRRRKRVRAASDSSDSDIIESSQRDLKGKLKEAIHISGIDGGLKNTLETRLKAMGGLGATSESTVAVTEIVSEVQVKETQNNDDKEKSLDKIDDAELENLRMEALKTAMLNKCQRRKRKRALLETPEAVTSLQTIENKENNTPKDEQGKPNNGEKLAIDDIEEDEDVLRASLLATLGKNIVKKQIPNENIIQVKQAIPKLPASVIPALPKRLTNKFRVRTLTKLVNKQAVNKPGFNKMISKINRAKPQVRPLIINVNSDSDSDEEMKSKPDTKPPITLQITSKTIPTKLPESKLTTAPNVTDLNTITTNVEKFLREQRAKFETETQKKAQTVSANKDKTILEKSAVKLLPKSQQLEYQQLVRQLRNAQKRQRAKKLALANNNVQMQQTVTITEPLQSAISIKVTPMLEAVVTETCAQTAKAEVNGESVEKSDSGSVVTSSRMSDISDAKKQRITNELTTLQKTLKDIKMQRNGSLQIKSKYQVLTPIIRKITMTSNERKKQEHRIKTLLQELNEARNSLSKSHERFSTLVQELVANKAKIDRSSQELRPAEKKADNGTVTQETKLINTDTKFENPRVSRVLPITSTPIKSQLDNIEEVTISSFATTPSNNECEDMDVCNSDETDFGHIDIVDPNDIDQIFKRRPPMKSAIPEYISPLNYPCYDRYRNVDPLGIMCPYEVNGSCRDCECTYKHYLKSN